MEPDHWDSCICQDRKQLFLHLLVLCPLFHVVDVIAGRFEDGVIEERRKAALELLTFAGNFADLFTSQPFVKFFEVMMQQFMV